MLIEGAYDSRLDVIKDVPKGKCLYHFESTDIFNAKKVLGDTVCLMGNVPNSLLATGTPQSVGDYCKRLIDVCGDGGFILSSGAIIDEARPENAHIMMKTAREYDKYR